MDYSDYKELRAYNYHLHKVLDIQTKNGLIVPVKNIIDGYETIPSVFIKNKKLIINIKNIDTPVKDIQLNSLIIFLDVRNACGFVGKQPRRRIEGLSAHSAGLADSGGGNFHRQETRAETISEPEA